MPLVMSDHLPVKLSCMNVRSIEGYKKEGLLQRLVKDIQQDIWFLTETKLTRNIRFDGFYV